MPRRLIPRVVSDYHAMVTEIRVEIDRWCCYNLPRRDMVCHPQPESVTKDKSLSQTFLCDARQGARSRADADVHHDGGDRSLSLSRQWPYQAIVVHAMVDWP
jgi:hypothetical protein